MKIRDKYVEEKERYVYKMYRNLFLVATLIVGISEILQYKSLGEAPALILKLSKIDIFMLLLLQSGSLMLMIPIFNMTKKLNIMFLSKNFRLGFNEKKIHKFILVMLIVNILFTLSSGNGVVGGEVSSKFSFIFNIIKIRPLMSIYYICLRNKSKNNFWINIVIYIIYELLCGWSGFVMAYFFYELFLYVRKKNTSYFVRIFYKFSIPSTLVLISVGAEVYRYLIKLKYKVRLGVIIGLPSYIEGINALVSRLTNFPITVLATQEHIRVARLYQAQGIPFAEVLNIFRPLVPSVLMPNKNFRILGNIVKQVMYFDIEKGTSTGYCPFIYWFNLAESDFICFLVGIFFFIIFFAITQKILYSFDDGTGKMDILWFLFIANIFCEGANLGSLFGYGYTSLIYTIPILILIGVIKRDSINVDLVSSK